MAGLLKHDVRSHALKQVAGARQFGEFGCRPADAGRPPGIRESRNAVDDRAGLDEALAQPAADEPSRTGYKDPRILPVGSSHQSGASSAGASRPWSARAAAAARMVVKPRPARSAMSSSEWCPSDRFSAQSFARFSTAARPPPVVA